MTRFLKYLVVSLCAVLVFGCQQEGEDTGKTTENSEGTSVVKAAEPDSVTVQHILIGFTGSVPGKNITRTKAEAQSLAEDILKRARAGEDFDQLVVEFTDDSAPGKYKLANFGIEADMARGVFPRDRMVQAFGDVGFPLAVGEIGLAHFDPAKSKFGWHVIKRVE